MKILDVSSISDTSQFPIKKGTLQFLQDAHKEVFNEMLIAQLNGVGSFPYVLNGMLNIGSGLNYIISAGSVFDPNTGEVFLCDGNTFTASVGQVGVVSLVTTQYGTDADPVTFTDGVTRNVHNIRKIQVTAGTAGGSGTTDYICDYSDLVFNRFAIPEVASQSEVNTGTNDVKIVTPLTLATLLANTFGVWTKDTAATNWSYAGGSGTITFTGQYIAYKIVGKMLTVNFSANFDVVTNTVQLIKYTFPSINRTGLQQINKSIFRVQGATSSFAVRLTLNANNPFTLSITYNEDGGSTQWPVATGYLVQGEFTVEIN